jgi:DNA-binding CsgD family transcriptional regulator
VFYNSKRLWFLGFGLYWAWTHIAFFTPMLFPSFVSGIAITAQEIWITYAAVSAVVRVLLVIFSKRIVSVLHCNWAVAGCVILGVFGTLLIPLGNFLTLATLNDELWVSFLGAGVAGIGCAGISTAWAETYLDTKEEDALLSITLVFIFAVALYFLISLLPEALGIILTASLHIGSGACLIRERGKATISTASSGKQQNVVRIKPRFSLQIIIPLLAIFFYASCGELLHTFTALPGDRSDLVSMGNYYTGGGAIGVASLLIVSLILKLPGKRPSKELPYLLISLVFMAIGMILPVLFNLSFYLTYAVFGAAFWCFRNVVWIYSTRIINRLDLSPLIVFGLSQGTFGIAIFMGSPVVRFISYALHLGDISWEMVAIVAVFIILTFAIVLANQLGFNQGGPNQLWGLLPPQESVNDDAVNEDRQLSFLIDRCNMTSREFEVAKLLAKGRSLPFIQENLYIASGTAKTHLRHIYQKTGVHNRQEFLDFIDHNKKEETP